MVKLRCKVRERIAGIELECARGLGLRQRSQPAPDRSGTRVRRRHHGAAHRAGAVLDAREESAEDGRELRLDIMDVQPLEIQTMAAALAVPGKSVELRGGAAPLHHDADRARAALRRVRDFGGQQEHLALADGHVDPAFPLDGLQHDVALELIKELRTRVVVEILARVGTAHGHHDELAVLEQQFVAHGRLEECAVLVDPGTQIERRRNVHRCDYSARPRRPR